MPLSMLRLNDDESVLFLLLLPLATCFMASIRLLLFPSFVVVAVLDALVVVDEVTGFIVLMWLLLLLLCASLTILIAPICTVLLCVDLSSFWFFYKLFLELCMKLCVTLCRSMCTWGPTWRINWLSLFLCSTVCSFLADHNVLSTNDDGLKEVRFLRQWWQDRLLRLIPLRYWCLCVCVFLL